MKSDSLVGVVGTVVTALAGIVGVIYTQQTTVRVERLKLEQARVDELRRTDAEALANLARELATAMQRATYVLWQVEMTASSLTDAEFASYEKESRQQLPSLMSAQVLLAAVNHRSHEQLLPSIKEFYRLDEQIAVAGRMFRLNKEEALALLGKEVMGLQAQHAQLFDNLAAASEAITTSRVVGD